MSNSITLISHFYNEEFLLPFWIKHHYPMFDHGIMIDYASTDRSVDIIKELAPNWEIRPSRNQVFDFVEIDKEVMDIEAGLTGWKMCLNTTEFLVHSDFRGFLATQQGIGVRTTGLIMVDRPEDRANTITNDPLVLQKRYGYAELENTAFPARCRLVHRNTTGQYTYGRHTTELGFNEIISPELYLCWFGWCPIDHVKSRKLQIKTRIPSKHFKKGYGVQHNIDEQKLEELYLAEAKLSVDLWEHVPAYRMHLDRLYKRSP